MQNINAVILLDKPPGMTSNRALQRVKALIEAKKGGHTGSLDPFATGMLPLCFGEATKISHYLLNEKKTYLVEVKLGISTSTGDIDGEITGNSKIKEYPEDHWKKILNEFKGESEQIPPMHSALRYKGKRLYELARKGEVVDRAARKIEVFSIELVDLSKDKIDLEITCSKGTYIRVLAEDIAKKLGMLAHVSRLRRKSVGNFCENKMVKLSILEDLTQNSNLTISDYFITIDEALTEFSVVNLNNLQSSKFRNGQQLELNGYFDDNVKVYDHNNNLVGIAYKKNQNTLAPKRIFHLS
tara:strand:+ start:830 stop:1723 length:894 start_codon:yes stop_codon:yes gene_type:complete